MEWAFLSSLNGLKAFIMVVIELGLPLMPAYRIDSIDHVIIIKIAQPFLVIQIVHALFLIFLILLVQNIALFDIES